MTTDPTMRFYSLFDGKQPLLMWLFGISSSVFTDPLFAGRSVTVLFSILTFLGIYKLSKEFFKGIYLYLPVIFYTITPLFLFFDRQALMESPINTISIWSLYFLIKALKTKKRLYAVLLGITLGIGFFIKSNALLFIFTSFLFLIYKAITKKGKDYFVLCCIIFLSILFILFSLFTQPDFSVIISRGDRFNFTLSEIFSFPITSWIKNATDFITISWWQLTPPLFILTLTGIIAMLKNKKVNIILYWFLLPLLTAIITIRGFSTRYVEVLLPPIIFIATFGLLYITKWKKLLGIIACISLLLPLYLSFLLIINPLRYFSTLNFYTPKFSQKTDYVTGNTSGYGIKAVVSYLQNKSFDSPIIVGVRLDAGNPENAILAYFFKNNKIQATYFDKQMFADDFDFKLLKHQFPIYYVSRSQHQGGLENYLVEDKRFYKPEGEHYFGVYKFDIKQ